MSYADDERQQWPRSRRKRSPTASASMPKPEPKRQAGFFSEENLRRRGREAKRQARVDSARRRRAEVEQRENERRREFEAEMRAQGREAIFDDPDAAQDVFDRWCRPKGDSSVI